jgi:hypothetical protein
MYDWPGQSRSKTLQQELWKYFWQPLIRNLEALEEQPLRSRAILLLTGSPRSFLEGELRNSNLINPNSLIFLDPFEEITSEEISDWIESEQVFAILSQLIPEEQLRVLIDEEIQDWVSDPTLVIEEICYLFELENGIADIETEWRLLG